MITAIQIFCLVVAGISFIGMVGEKQDKSLRIAMIIGALGFTVLAAWIELNK